MSYHYLLLELTHTAEPTQIAPSTESTIDVLLVYLEVLHSARAREHHLQHSHSIESE